MVYTTLLVYQHVAGPAGGASIPGLAAALPTISSDGKTYTMTLRKNLVYSNGAPVKASDFTHPIERALKLNWGGDSFYTGNIIGATAYTKGAKTISGITTDNATGKITIHLLAPYGAFENVLAFPSSGFVPAGTAMTNLTNNPPPGVGPYMIKNVVPAQSLGGRDQPVLREQEGDRRNSAGGPSTAHGQGREQHHDRERGRSSTTPRTWTTPATRSRPRCPQVEARRPAATRRPSRRHDVLLLHQHHDEAVQQPARA